MAANPAKPDRAGEATVALPAPNPPELGATQDLTATPPIPHPHRGIAETTRLPPEGFDPAATAYFDVEGDAKQTQVGDASSSGFRFRIMREHARGGLGQVSVAEDMELHREVALKEILLRHAGNAESQARFVMEAEITGGLEHPGIVPVYGLGTYADGRPFYAMRFIRGESLEDTIQRFHEEAAKRDPGRTAVELRQLISRFVAVCHAIEYAHSRAILHRDIKPANIMLGKYGETLVVDWGIAKLMNQPETAPQVVAEEGTLRPVSASDTTATQMGTTIGTPQYMSPEQAAGRLDMMGAASDVYSLGATLYFMLTGQPAFTGDRLFEMLRRVERGEFSPPRSINKNIPKQLDAICMKAMALEPADRYASARALSDDLEHWMADEPVVAYRESASERFMRWLRHHKSWAQASLITLLAVAAVSIVAALIVNEARRREVEAHQESERQRILADESFRQARAAVDEFFTEVSESTLLNVAGMQPLRHDLLKVALTYEQKFLEQRGDDPKLQSEAAAAMFRVALVTGVIESQAKALPLFEKARDIQERLLAAEPGNASLRYALSDSYNELGRAHYVASRLEDATVCFRQSRELRERLVRDDEENLKYQRKLASTYDTLGTLAKHDNRRDEALNHYGLAQEIRKKLIDLDPNEPLFRRDLARGHYNLGILARESQNFEQAIASLKEAASGYDGLYKDNPLVTEYRQELGICRRVLGDVYIQTGQQDAALEALGNARVVLQRLANENPYLVSVAAQLAAVYDSLARLHELRGDVTESLSLVEQASGVLRRLVETNPDVLAYKADLANNLVRTGTLQRSLGNHAAARDAFQEARDTYKNAGSNEPAHRAGWGRSLINLGVEQNQLGKTAEAIATLEDARKRFEELLHEYPKQVALDFDLALCHSNLGLAHQSSQELDAALASFEQARQIHEKYLSDASLAAMHRPRLIETWLDIARLETAREQAETALAAYQTARTLAEEQIKPQGDNSAAWAWIATACHGRGGVLLEQDDSQAAMAAYLEATDFQRRVVDAAPDSIFDRESLSRYYKDLALVEKQVGRLPDAIATMLKRKSLRLEGPQYLYDVARDLAALAPASSSDLSDTEKEARAKQLDLVIDLLIGARRAGYTDWEATEKDETFAPLRDLDAFRKLLSDE